jgi:Zn-dependent M28 family amino/carboxypeptidase
MSSTSPPNGVAKITQREAFAGAKRAWVAGSYASSFEQSTYLYRAANRLVHGVVPGAPGDARYKVSIRQLRQLASLPETSDTPTQVSEAHADLRALNVFFGTKDLYD